MGKLIDAEETRETIRNHALGAFNLSDAFEFYLKGLTKADDIIANAPAVDAEPVRHGYWIKHWDDIWPEESTWECSLCHEEQGRGMLDTNYCPNCGARMDGERREDEAD